MSAKIKIKSVCLTLLLTAVLMGHVKGEVFSQEAGWRQLHDEGSRLIQQGNYMRAAETAKDAVAAAREAFGDFHPNVATTLNQLALVYQKQGKYKDAAPLYEKVLNIDINTLEEGHPYIATTEDNLGNLYILQARYEEARDLLLDAFAIREKTLGETHPEVAASLVGLARLEYIQSHYAEATLLVERALIIDQRIDRGKSLAVARDLNLRALIHQAHGETKQAELLHKKALSLREEFLGKDHLRVAQSLNNLGITGLCLSSIFMIPLVTASPRCYVQRPSRDISRDRVRALCARPRYAYGNCGYQCCSGNNAGICQNLYVAVREILRQKTVPC